MPSSPSSSSSTPTSYGISAGGCLCGGVKFTIKDEARLRPLIACHCEQCRKSSGSFVIATKIRSDALCYETEETLVWYPSSEWARRGFCGRCGSLLFYHRQKSKDGETIDAKDDWLSVMLGALDDCASLPFVGHIFTSQAHPSIDCLSTTARCARWGEQPLIEALHKEGWIDTNNLAGEDHLISQPPPQKQRL